MRHLNIKTELSKLKTMDIFSVMLFALYKIKDLPEYSALSELAYILDKDSLLKVCEYFGGLTLKIPTIEELETLIYALILYQYVDIEGISMDAASEIISHSANGIKKIKLDYVKIKNLLSDYEFTSRIKDDDA